MTATWFTEMTPEKQHKFLDHLHTSEELGKARKVGDWGKAKQLSQQVSDYYTGVKNDRT